ncbi:MAG TPA: outer-membrane lipoprotein carrier protein LolA [Candidatus Angelobacter sp.]|nr:outer-membrane lipoprotein carrier protein LolA [Candidatus Angelobacter sp.]
MRKLSIIPLLLAGLLATGGATPGAHKAMAVNHGKQTAQQSNAGQQGLDAILEQMNKAAAAFRTAQADFEWDQYERVVEEHDIQNGRIYFRRTKSGIDASIKVTSPDSKQVLFKDGKLMLYQPKIDQVTEYKSNANRAEVESFMSLGFGASGKDLAANFEIKLDGWETIDGVKTAKLDLTPKQEKVRSSLSRVLLWMDPVRDVSLKQQFFEPSGDYRLTHYTNIRLNRKISDDVFRLKTRPGTRIVTP